MKQTPNIHPHADVKGLIAAVILRAARDLAGQDPRLAIDSLLWLTSRDFEVWKDALNPDLDMNPYKMLSSGRVLTLPGIKEKRPPVAKSKGTERAKKTRGKNVRRK